MMDTSQPQADPAKRFYFYRMRRALGMIQLPDEKPRYIWVERWNAFIIGTIIAVGLPLLGLSGFSFETKQWILIGWLTIWALFFMYFEGRELIGQMTGRGSIRPEQLSEQQDTSQGPFYGCVIALAIWIVVLAVHVTIVLYPQFDGNIFRFVAVQIPVAIWHGLGTTPVYYGLVEWWILIHVWIGTGRINHIMYNVGNIFSKATPMKEMR